METLNIVIAEILLCLVLAWVLGFLAAWILFRKVQNEYEQEIEELEENLSHVSSSNKNQEREITMQNIKIQELEKTSNKDVTQKQEKRKEENSQKNINSKKNKNAKNKKNSNDAEMLKLIDSNLYSPKKKS